MVSNLTQINDKMTMPPPEPIGRKTSSQPGQYFTHPNQNDEPTSQDLIEMAAQQCLKESDGSDAMMLNRKLNAQAFSQLKFQENKKRNRPHKE